MRGALLPLATSTAAWGASSKFQVPTSAKARTGVGSRSSFITRTSSNDASLANTAQHGHWDTLMSRDNTETTTSGCAQRSLVEVVNEPLQGLGVGAREGDRHLALARNRCHVGDNQEVENLKGTALLNHVKSYHVARAAAR